MMMSVPLFDPIPEPPPDLQRLSEQSWSPPLWDRPSEGTLPAVVSVSRLFERTENVALALDHLRVYPSGFQLVITILASPRLPTELRMGGFDTMTLLAARETPNDDDTPSAPPLPPSPRYVHLMGPRIGVEFSNGQRAGTRPMPHFDVPRDKDGMPTEPVMMGGGGGGGGGQFRWEHWVFPLPSPGPLTVFAEWSTARIEETSMVISGTDVRDAAQRAIVLWS